MADSTPSQGLPQVRWLQVYNENASPVPPFGLMRPTGVDEDGVITVDQPDTDSQVGLLINGPSAIQPEDYGQGHQSYPAPVAYQGDDPANGEQWGSEEDSWYLTTGKTGYRIVGGASDGVVNVTEDAAGTESWQVDTPSAWGSSQNNWAADHSHRIHRVSASTTVNLTGIAATGLPATQATWCILWNVGSNTITLKHQSGSSTAANRLILPGDGDYSLAANFWAFLLYDPETDRWRLLNTGSGGTSDYVTYIQVGIVSLADQYMGQGIKRFENVGFVDVRHPSTAPVPAPVLVRGWDSSNGVYDSPYAAAGVVELYNSASNTNRPGLLAGRSAFGYSISILNEVEHDLYTSFIELEHVSNSIKVNLSNADVTGTIVTAEATTTPGNVTRTDFKLGNVGTPDGSYWCRGVEGETGTVSPVGSITVKGGLVTDITMGTTVNPIGIIRRARP